MAGHVFEEHPFGAAFVDDARDFGPEMAGIVGAAALSSGAERLARISGEDGIKRPAEGPGIEAAKVVPDRGGRKVARAAWAAMRTARGQSSHSTKARVWKPGSASMTPRSRPPPPAQSDNPCRGRDTMPFTAPLASAAAPA